MEIKKNYVAFYGLGGLRFKVKVKAERRNYGRSDCLIVPSSGEGETWVSKENLEDEEGIQLTKIKAIDRDDADDDS